MSLPLPVEMFDMNNLPDRVELCANFQAAIDSLECGRNSVAFFKLPDLKSGGPKKTTEALRRQVDELARIKPFSSKLYYRPVNDTCFLHCDPCPYNMVICLRGGTMFLTPEENDILIRKIEGKDPFLKSSNTAYHKGDVQLWRTPSGYGVVFSERSLHTPPFLENPLLPGARRPHRHLAALRFGYR